MRRAETKIDRRPQYEARGVQDYRTGTAWSAGGGNSEHNDVERVQTLLRLGRHWRNISGSLAMFAAICSASSLVSSLAAYSQCIMWVFRLELEAYDNIGTLALVRRFLRRLCRGAAGRSLN